jgi:hypothetical protein
MKKLEIYHRNHTLIFECEDIEEGIWYDTKVTLNGSYLMTIAGNTVNEFIVEFKLLIDKYQI